MSAKRDYYEVLGVTKTSSLDEIKNQYRKLALKFHPDRNQSADAGEHFKEISEAYAILSDSEKKQTYDQYGHEGVDGRYSNDDIFGRGGGGGGFNDIFESIFGRGGGGGGFTQQQQRGSDLLYQTTVTLEDVLHGKKMEINLQKQIKCNNCSGSGCKPGTNKKTCATCNGQGEVRQTRDMGFASFVTAVPCPTCRGEGSMIEKPCSNCKGQGRVKGTKKVDFQIPPGIDSGDYIVSNEGNEIPNGVNGDLVIRVQVQPHRYFHRDGKDIFYDQDISMIDAALGCEISVPTLEGNEKVKVNSGSQPNHIIKLKGKGVSHINSRGTGDQFIRMVVTIPKKLSKHQKNLLNEFQETTD